MLWLFAVCLIGLVSLFGFKLYQSKSGELKVLTGSRSWLDKRLRAAEKYLRKQCVYGLKTAHAATHKSVVRVRNGVAKWLRTVAKLIEDE